MSRLMRMGLGLALMSVCLAKPNDAGAAPAADPPATDEQLAAETKAAREQRESQEMSAQAQVTRLAEYIQTAAPEAIKGEGAVDTAIALIGDGLNASQALVLVQGERDRVADDMVRLGDFLHEAGFVSESGGPESDVTVAIHHLGLKAGYQSSLEASAGIIDNFQTQIERLGSHILAVAPGAIEGSAIDTAIKLIDERAPLQLALETAQARAKREVEEALTGDGTEQVEKPDAEIRHIRGRRRLVPRGWPAG